METNGLIAFKVQIYGSPTHFNPPGFSTCDLVITHSILSKTEPSSSAPFHPGYSRILIIQAV